ncbi:MAG TPA: M14 family metallopeptidase [Dongiaceae bacterium]|nr:M14 family metallopeptidase [Dongiaceae bacterium]
MQASSFFARDYREARSKFHDAAAAKGLQITSHRNPTRGPAGEELATDTVWIGPRDASRLFIGLSGTHGAEGFCGSGIQVGWLGQGLFDRLPADTAVLLIHAINPSGFAWVRRVTEDNVDLNRNFVDHKAPKIENPGYRQLRDAISPVDWSPENERRNKEAFAEYAEANGPLALQAAITSGQYWDDHGVFYGGQTETWSNRTLHRILAAHAPTVKRAAFIDLHTGLGPYGVGEIMSNHFGDSTGNRFIRDWWGDEATFFDDGSTSSAVTTGDTQVGVDRALPQTQVGGITLEYGTLPLEQMIDAVRADNWVHLHGELDSAKGRGIKADIRSTFYPDKDDWKAMVWDRAVYALDGMMRGLTQS